MSAWRSWGEVDVGWLRLQPGGPLPVLAWRVPERWNVARVFVPGAWVPVLTRLEAQLGTPALHVTLRYALLAGLTLDAFRAVIAADALAAVVAGTYKGRW